MHQNMHRDRERQILLHIPIPSDASHIDKKQFGGELLNWGWTVSNTSIRKLARISLVGWLVGWFVRSLVRSLVSDLCLYKVHKVMKLIAYICNIHINVLYD